MRRLVACAFLLPLSGCGLFDSGPKPGSAQAFCAAQADSTPAVKALVIRSVSNPYFMSQSSELIAATKAQAVRDCLKRQGVLPSGGAVEGLPHSDTIFQK